MTRFMDLIKPSVRAAASYHLKERRCAVKLNQNENPYDLPTWLKDEMFSEFGSISWNRYPSFANSKLREKLSHYSDIEPNRLLVGNGSNELLQNVMNVVLSAGRNLLLVTPTFKVYEQLSAVAEAEIIQCEFEEDWSFPTEQVLEAVHKQPVHLCVLCSPNSPTGSSIPEEALIEILEATHGLVLVDEAYHEFSGTTFVKLQQSHENLIITRTFSKALGLAGLRIGYLIAHPDLIREFNKAKLPYNLNVFSELVATKLLEHPDLIAQNIERILAERTRVENELRQLSSVEVYPSQANFFMLAVPSGTETFAQLFRQGVLVRDISNYHPRLKDHLRVSVGSVSENNTLIDAFKTV